MSLPIGRISFGNARVVSVQRGPYESGAWKHLPSAFRYSPPRHLIYCWQCNAVEVMSEGVASEDFKSLHRAHQDTVQIIQIDRGHV